VCYDVWCVFPFAPPPLVFIGGSHGQGELHLQVCLLELTYTSNEEAPRGRFESVGPMGWSTDGWPPSGPNRPMWAALWAHLSLACVMASIMSVPCSSWASNPCVDTCHALICWNIVPWIMPHHYVAKLAKNHLHTF